MVSFRCLAAAAVMSVAASAMAQQQAGPTLSPSCSAPLSDIAQPAPLPHVAGALRAKRPVRIIAIGSSSTAGVGASAPSKSYPVQLETILEKAFGGIDIVMQNRGIPGELAQVTADRLKRELAGEQPDLVLWQVGTNDVLANAAPDAFKAAVQSTVRWLKERQIDVVLVGLQYTRRLATDPHTMAIRRALREVASTEITPLVLRFDAMKFIAQGDEGKLLALDGLHQNDLGYRCMAEQIARALIVSAFGTDKPGVFGR